MTAISIYFFGITIIIVRMIYSAIMTIKEKYKGNKEESFTWLLWWLAYSLITTIALEDIDLMIKRLEL